MTAEVWLLQSRAKGAAEYARALAWYVARVGHMRRKLDLRPRVPDNRYSVELPVPPVRASLPDVLVRLGLRRATVEQWWATVNELAAKGVRAEEPRQSGVLQSQQIFRPARLSRWMPCSSRPIFPTFSPD